jgi:GNAT superfamily N-acetyltransferase
MIRKLTDEDFETIFAIVNEAAVAYKGKIPADRWKEPYMSFEELKQQIRDNVQFYGYAQHDRVVAVMGIQTVGDVTLIRHAYTLTSYQRRGIGEKLLNHLLRLAKTQRVLVGTWTDALWAIRFYQKNGFTLLNREATNKLLTRYWKIPARQIETSVVLELNRRCQ